jgi:hypothetical protein
VGRRADSNKTAETLGEGMEMYTTPSCEARNRELGLRERSCERNRRDLGKGKRRAKSENIL